MQKSIIQTSHLKPYRLFLSKEKARSLANVFINCQFLYAPLIWMFASIRSINKICKIHLRTLQIVHNIHDKLYEELLPASDDVSVYQKHLPILAIEVYKSLMKTNPYFVWNFYTIKPIPYDLRTGKKVYLSTVNTIPYGLNSLIFRGSLLWNNLPTSITISQSLAYFKNDLRHFRKIHCTCVVCR